MVKASKLNYALLLVLITVFLTMQWTTTHIHLSQKHNHTGSQHQHKVETHGHQLTDQYVIDYGVDSDVSHEVSHANIVDIDHEFTLSKSEKQKFSPLAVGPPPFQLLQYSLPIRIKVPVILNTKLSFFDRSTVSPRAPPKTS